MSIQPGLAWLLPVVAPFIIGLLVGSIIKRTMKLFLAVVALVAILMATGAISMTFKDIFAKAMEFLPRVIETGEAYKDVLPYTSATFLIGLALGLWRT